MHALRSKFLCVHFPFLHSSPANILGGTHKVGGFLNITCTLCEANSYACISTLLCLQLTRFTPQLSWSDSNGNRTRVTAVKGRCLNRLTMEPYNQLGTTDLCPIKKNSPSRARTYNNSVNSRVLYHWAIEENSKERPTQWEDSLEPFAPIREADS